MGRSLARGLAWLLGVFALVGCGAAEEAEAPTFRITAPTSDATTTTVPARLAWLGESNLTPAERELCSLIVSIDTGLAAAEEQNRLELAAAERAVEDPTLSEPLRVRRLRDAELANATRLASVLLRLDEGRDLLEGMSPTENLPADSLAGIEADMASVVAIGEVLLATIETLEPLDASDQAAYRERTGLDWRDLFTEAELQQVRAELYNDRTGLGRLDEARELLDRIDDWSWRHCSEGFSE